MSKEIQLLLGGIGIGLLAFIVLYIKDRDLKLALIASVSGTLLGLFLIMMVGGAAKSLNLW